MHDILNFAFYFMTALILGSVVISWFPRLRWNPVGMWVYDVSERLLKPFRAVLRPINLGGGAGIDLSPLLAFFAVQLIYTGLVMLFKHMGMIS